MVKLSHNVSEVRVELAWRLGGRLGSEEGGGHSPQYKALERVEDGEKKGGVTFIYNPTCKMAFHVCPCV